MLLHDRVARQAAGVRVRLRVIGHTEVAKAARARGAGHVGDGGTAVAILRVTVQRADQIGLGQQSVERAMRRRLDFPARFPLLGHDIRKPDVRVEVALVQHRKQGTVGATKFIAGEHEATRRGTLGHLLHMRRASGRAPERERELLRTHAGDIDTQSIVKAKRHGTTAAPTP